jgi:hypothetical protein
MQGHTNVKCHLFTIMFSKYNTESILILIISSKTLTTVDKQRAAQNAKFS